MTTAPNFEGTAGGDGALTLAQQGNAVVATLSFGVFATGAITLTPMTATSAGFDAGDYQTVDYKGANQTVTTKNGVLHLVGDTLFVSLYGSSSAGGGVSGYFHCPIPTSLPLTNITASTPLVTTVAPGVYGPCTSSLDAAGSSLSGGSGSVTIAANANKLEATWGEDVSTVCKALDFGAAPSTASLGPGQTCDIEQPCGPPPTMGPPPNPSDATMTNMMGAMTLDAHSLIINVLGDTTAQTCGRHDLSIICAP